MRTRHPLRKQLTLFIRPFIASTVLAVFWYVCFFETGIGFEDADESVFTDAIIPVLATFHAIVAGFALNKVWSEYTIVQRCLKTNDREAFIAIRDDRIPMPIHFLLGSIAFLIQVLVMLQNYEGPDAGMAATFAISFVLVLYWEVATNLDDPKTGVWYVDRIPTQWFEDPPVRKADDADWRLHECDPARDI